MAALRLAARRALTAGAGAAGLFTAFELSHSDGAGGSLDKYSIGRTLGEGGFAVVKLAKLKATGEAFALKLVDKARTAEATMREEIGVMAALGRHPHIVGLVETFETKGAWALVLDLATGGEVFDRICEEGPYSERSAAALVREVAEALDHVHSKSIAHCDLKPENLLLASKAADAPVRVCDFGLAGFFGRRHAGRRGTVTYMAPEIFASKEFTFDPGVDMWALGVILFVLLGGYHPFDPEGVADDKLVAYRVRAGEWSFDDDECWQHVSKEAKGVIRSLLSGDASRRPSAAALLQNPWVQGDASAKPLPNSDQRLAAFNDARRMWRSAIRAASFVNLSSMREARDEARRASETNAPRPPTPPLSAEATEELRAAFDAFDTDGSGCIDSKEMQAALTALGVRGADASKTIAALDLNNSGTITFEEFCAHVAPFRGGYGSSEEALRRVFDLFDVDRSGAIDRAELRRMLAKLRLLPPDAKAADAAVERMFASADANNDGGISFTEFLLLVRSSLVEQPPQR